MSSLYFFLGPVIVLTVVNRIKKIRSSIKNKNNDQLKVHLLFLFLIMIVSAIMVLAIEFI